MSVEEYLYSVAILEKEGPVASFLRFLLLACSFVYGAIVWLFSFIHRFMRFRLKCKVISVGNITVGGTGKTPMIEALLNFLRVNNRRIAVVSRGYKIKQDDIGDEVEMLKNKFSDVCILSGRNRVKNIKKAVNEFKVETVILDDGFQHWRIFRDLDIVMVDSTNPFGNNYLLPRGVLREPLKSLKRADIFVLTKTDLARENLSFLKHRLAKFNPEAEIFESIHKPVSLYNLKNEEIHLPVISDKNVCLVCAIADPVSFEKTLLNLGAKILLKFVYRDHYNYQEGDLKNIFDNCLRLNAEFIITTEKDIGKIKPLLNKFDIKIKIIVLRIKLEISQEHRFYDRLLSIYKR